MGGYGSSRWGSHRPAATVEASKRLPLREVLAGGPGTRTMHWTWRGEPSGAIRYTVEPGLDRVWLSYSTPCPGSEARSHRAPLDVVPVVTAAGARQRFWRCPVCRRRVRDLYLPGGADTFACRHCHQLVYASAQRHDKRFDALAALMRGDIAAFYRHEAHAPRSLRHIL